MSSAVLTHEIRGRVAPNPSTCTTNVVGMAAQRLPRGTRVDPIRYSVLVERDRKEFVEKIAARGGVSSAVFFERMVDHMESELTDRGLPSWWPAPEANENELPIDTA